MAREAKRYLVIPDAESVRVVGTSAADLGLAIECWAVVLANATGEVEELMSPAEWNMVAPYLARLSMDPAIPEAGRYLREALYRYCDTGLLERLGRLTYPQVWAIILACRYWRVARIRIKPGEHWWKLEHRLREV
jgi:hypothetical protein